MSKKPESLKAEVRAADDISAAIDEYAPLVIQLVNHGNRAEVIRLVSTFISSNGHVPRKLSKQLEEEIQKVVDDQIGPERTKPLTPRQQMLLELLEQYIDVHGFAPLIEEIRDALGVRSKATVYQHLEQLKALGYIDRKPRKARGITLRKRSGNEFYVIAAEPSQAPERALERAKQAVGKAKSFQQAHQALLLAQILALSKARSASLYLVDEFGERLEPYVWQGCWLAGEKPRAFNRGEGIAGFVWETEEAFVSSEDIQGHPRFQLSDDPRSRTVRSIFAVPIFDFDGRLIGIFNLDSNVVDRFSYRLKGHIDHLVRGVYSAMRKQQLERYLGERYAAEMFLWLFKSAIAQYYA